MNYSTLQEAYNIDTFEKKSRPSHKQNKNNGNNGAMIASSNTSPAFTESSKLALSSNKLSDYPNNNGSSCSPLQAPTYNIPVSNQCKKEHDDAMNVYTSANNNNISMMNNMGNMNSLPNNGMQTVPPASPQGSLSSAPSSQPTPSVSLSSANQGSLLPSSTTSSLNYSTNMFNSLKSSNDNVMPYYDEDLEQYFNISNLSDEVKYNSNNSTNAYMPNYNNQSYTNNDTTEYTNNTIIPKNGNNLLNNSSYNLTPEEKKSADEAIAYLKSIEDKINSSNINSSGYNKSSIPDPVLPTNNTGPGGFKTPTPPVPTPPATPPATATPPEKPEKEDKPDKTNYIYNAIFNISILLIIGIAIILLCDQMVELAIHIGMKRVVNILEPFLKNQVPAQELIQQVSN
jgi:hypothetical protein